MFSPLSPLAPLHPRAPSCTSGPHTRFHARQEFLTGSGLGGSAGESGRRLRRRAGRAWGGRKELEFPLLLNEGEESARDSAVVATKEATAPGVGCSPTHIPVPGEGAGDWLGPLES